MSIEKISLNFNKKVAYKSKNYSYESLLLDNTQQLANFIAGKRKDLQFDIPIMKIDDGRSSLYSGSKK